MFQTWQVLIKIFRDVLESACLFVVWFGDISEPNTRNEYSAQRRKDSWSNFKI